MPSIPKGVSQLALSYTVVNETGID